MKKTLITVIAVAMFVAAFGAVGSAYAMEETGKGPGNGGYGSTDPGILSTYMNDAVAYTFGLDPVEVADRLAAGETYYDIAISMGYTEEFAPVLVENIRDMAIEAAAADGLQIQTQLNTNLGTQTQLHDGTCDGTADCLQNYTAPNLYTGSNAGMHGRRGGH